MDHRGERLFAALGEAAAATQFGLVTRRQFLESGLSERRLERLLSQRRLQVILPQVLAFPGSYKARLRVMAAAVLWYASADRRGKHREVATEDAFRAGAVDGRAAPGPATPEEPVAPLDATGDPEATDAAPVVELKEPPRRAVLSHWSAAELWEFQAIPHDHDVHVLREGRKCPRAHESIKPHGTDRLPKEDIDVLQGINVTSALRTIVDLATCVTAHELELAILDAVDRRLFTGEELRERVAAERKKKSHGIAALELVVERAGFDVVTESPLERETLQVLLDAGLRPEGQHKLLRVPQNTFVGRYDLVFKKEKVLIEVDSKKWHRAWKNKIRDGEKTDGAIALGYELVRVRRRDLCEPGRRAFLRRVREALATAPVRAAMVWPGSLLKPVKRPPRPEQKAA